MLTLFWRDSNRPTRSIDQILKEKFDSIEEGDEEEASPCSVPLTDKEEEIINLWTFGVSSSDSEDEVASLP